MRRLTPFFFLIPGFIFLTTWFIYPIIFAFQISMFKWNFMFPSQSVFIGLENYIQAFNDKLFLLSFINSFLYALVTVSGQLTFGLLIAIFIDKITKGRIFFRTIYYLPVVTSWVVCSLLFKYLFNSSSAGLVNFILTNILHITSDSIQWLNEPHTSFIALYSLGIWKGVGWTMVIFLAAIQSIPEEIIDAAIMDGADGFQLVKRITIPLLFPTIILVVVMLTIGAFQTYIPIALITRGGPLHRTEVLLSYMYDRAFMDRNYGYSAALSYIIIFIVFLISQLQMRLISNKE